MAIRITFLLAAFATLAQCAVLKNGVVLPTYANVCKRSQNDLDDCLKNSLQSLIQKISKDGIRQLNLPPLDPWNIEKMSLTYGTGYPFKVSMNVADSNTYGFSKLQFLKLRSSFDNPEKISMEIDFFNKKIFIDGRYAAEGLISDVPVIAKGQFNVSMNDVSGTFKLRGHLVMKDGEEYLQIDRATMRPDVGDMKIQMSNENNKYPELNNLFVTLMNQFWKVMYQELLPYTEESFNNVMTPTFNKATLKVPFNQLIPQ